MDEKRVPLPDIVVKVKVESLETTTGLWCDSCLKSSVVREVAAVSLGDDGGLPCIQRIVYCAECDRQYL